MNEIISQQKEILFVEDEVLLQRLCVRILNKNKYQTSVAKNAAEAFSLIQSGRFDLLITDLLLPDGSGTEVIQRFAEKFPDRQIIIITGSVTPQSRLREMHKDFNVKILPKPFDMEFFEETIRLMFFPPEAHPN